MKNLLKRLVALTLCAIFSFSLVACGTEEIVENERLNNVFEEKNGGEAVIDTEDPDKFGGNVSTIYAQTKQMIAASCNVSSITSKVAKRTKVSKPEAKALIYDAICFTTDMILYNDINLLTMSDGEVANFVQNVACILGYLGWLDIVDDMEDEEYEDFAEFLSYVLCELSTLADDIYEIENMIAMLEGDINILVLFEEDEDPEDVAEDIVNEYEELEDEEELDEEELDEEENKEDEEEEPAEEENKEEEKEEEPAEEEKEEQPAEEEKVEEEKPAEGEGEGNSEE